MSNKPFKPHFHETLFGNLFKSYEMKTKNISIDIKYYISSWKIIY